VSSCRFPPAHFTNGLAAGSCNRTGARDTPFVTTCFRGPRLAAGTFGTLRALRWRATAITGNNVPLTRLGFPVLSPAKTLHQFRRVLFPSRLHPATIASILSAMRPYRWLRNHDRTSTRRPCLAALKGRSDGNGLPCRPRAATRPRGESGRRWRSSILDSP